MVGNPDLHDPSTEAASTEPIGTEASDPEIEAELQGEDPDEEPSAAALERKVAELTARPPAPEARTGLAPSGEDAAKAAEAAFKSLEDDYPEIAAPLKAIIGPVLATVGAMQAQGRETARAVRAPNDDRAAAQGEKQARIVAENHPSFLDLTAAEPNDRQQDFLDWLDDQPATVQRMAVDNHREIRDFEAVDFVVGLYERDRGLSGGGAPAPTKDAGDKARRGLQRAVRFH